MSRDAISVCLSFPLSVSLSVYIPLSLYYIEQTVARDASATADESSLIIHCQLYRVAKMEYFSDISFNIFG